MEWEAGAVPADRVAGGRGGPSRRSGGRGGPSRRSGGGGSCGPSRWSGEAEAVPADEVGGRRVSNKPTGRQGLNSDAPFPFPAPGRASGGRFNGAGRSRSFG